MVGLQVACTGCTSLRCKSLWIDGGKHSKVGPWVSGVDAFQSDSTAFADGLPGPLPMARARYRQAEWMSKRKGAECVDEFYASVLWSWHAGAAEPGSAAQRLANQSLARLLAESQARGRLNPRQGLTVVCSGQERIVPIEMKGFPWSHHDVHELRVVGHYYHASLMRYHQREGLGVPVVVLRHKPPAAHHNDDFLPRTTAFAATAVLAPDGASLCLYDPLRVDCDRFDGSDVPLAFDTTSPIAYAMHHHPQTRVQDFLRPDQSRDPSILYFMEPYQRDKIPLILVHGLLSSPDAWCNVYNELRMHPEMVAGYQLWAFKYSTGAPFIRPAAELRSQLDQVVARYASQDGAEDCNPRDPLYRAVLVGHSMGGLISKLAIAHSGEEVWNAISHIPVESLAADASARAQLMERFYFDPHPIVRRAVFIATPHRGSSTAGRVVGRVADAMVHSDNYLFEQLMQDNIGAFKETIASGLPTSIDMLDPKQPFLETIGRLRLNAEVPKHTILGTKFHVAGHHPSDGIVTAASAQHPESVSEKRIAASHNGLLRNDETIDELLRILRLHLAESPAE